MTVDTHRAEPDGEMQMGMYGRSIGAALTMMVLSACGDEGTVGRTVCLGPEPGCEPALQPEPLKTVSSAVAAAQRLTPVWERAIQAHGGGMIESSKQVALAVGAGGALWVFRAEPSQVSVSTLDASGNPIAQQVVTPPADVAADAKGLVSALWSVTNHPMGPVLEVRWKCENEPEVDPKGCKREHLVFATDVTEPPARIAIPAGPGSNVPGYRTRDGESIVTISSFDVREVNLRGEQLWRHEMSAKALVGSGPHDTQQVGTGVFTDTSSSGGLGAALLADDTLVTGVGFPHGGGSQFFWAGLVGVAPSGESTMLTYYGQPHFEGYKGVIVVDRENRPIVVRRGESGDLVALRINGLVGVGHEIQREDFLPLAVEHVAVDDANTLYVTTPAGGRSSEARQQLLCRLPAEGNGRCLAIDGTRAFDMEATAPGVVFVLSDRGLARYDVPQD
jgi:hypothetical protein